MKTNMMRDIYTLRGEIETTITQDARNYNLRTHKEMNENPTYKHDTDTETENKDTQKYIENHNQTIKHTFKGRLILEDKSRHAIDDKYGRFNT
jgi:hypothetical protein